MQTRLCAGCGATFTATSNRLYCTDRCRWRVKDRKRRDTKRGRPPGPTAHICECCGSEYQTPHATRRYCSAACQRRAQRLRDGTLANPIKGVCRCGKPTEPQPGRPTARTCADCRREAIRRARRAAKMRRRNVVSDDYTLAEIADRDQWRCQLCGLKVRHGRQRYPSDPDGPSIDHILPITKGGQDVRHNVQLAHFACNARKHNRVWGEGEQLRLIG